MSSSEHHATLSLSLNNTSWLVLSIPVSQVKDYANKPLKWLRFLGFVIVGQEGHLSTSSTGPAIDYDEEIVARPYYFIFRGEPRLIDVNILNDRTSVGTTLSISTNCDNFRQRIIDRYKTCAISGEPKAQCKASHIIPHAKGSHYMQNLWHYRGGMYNLREELNDINDMRNGLLLITFLHRHFGNKEVAFLRTPNYALGVGDIPHVPGCGNTGPSATRRLTLQYFPGVEHSRLITRIAPHSSDVHIPQDTSEWPPDILLDMSYAAAALCAWGSKDFLDYVRSETKNIYYPGLDVPSSSGQVLGAAPGGPSTGKVAAHATRLHARNTKKRRKGQETFDMFDLVYALWTRSAREYGQQHMQEIEAAESARSKSKVEEWLQSIE